MEIENSSKFLEEISFQNTKKDYKENLKFHLKTFHPNHQKYYFGGIFSSIILIIVVMIFQYQYAELWYFFGFIAILYFLMFIFHIPVEIKYKLNSKNYPVNMPIKVSISDNGITLKINGSHGYFYWGQIAWIINNENYIFIPNSPKSTIIIPRRNFESQDEFNEFSDYVKIIHANARWKAAGYNTKPCPKCNQINLRILKDGSGTCLTCGYTFSELSN